jgi:hypothetical protein
MLRILLALIIIVLLCYMNPLSKFKSSDMDEKNKNFAQKQVEDVQNQVDYAKQMVKKEYSEE